MCFSNLVHSDAESKSQEETQEYRIPTRKFKNLGVLPGISGIRNSFQNSSFSGSRTLGLCRGGWDSSTSSV